MPAYVDRSASEVIDASDDQLLAELHRAYAEDGFVSQYTSQTLAWEASLPLLKSQLQELIEGLPEARDWRILLELPLYRLRKRVDLVVVADRAVVVVELKVGETEFHASDRRQVEDYALDLRDFHSLSHEIPLLPALWCTGAGESLSYISLPRHGVAEVEKIGREDLAPLCQRVHAATSGFPSIARDRWADGEYRPVPTVIEAATTLFAGHGVEEIARADAANLGEAARRVVSIIHEAQVHRRRAMIFLTGVPGSGKTLAGLQVVHRAVETNVEEEGDIVFLSGNTPLVTVLREALVEDEYARRSEAGESVRKGDVRHSVKSRIQHIIDFLKEYLAGTDEAAPHEHAIVFDEAQRAWDERYGAQKFGRTASEPRLLLEIMGRHEDWCAIVGLVGGGQEINTGENGIAEWGDALRDLPPTTRAEWHVYGPPKMLEGDQSTAFLGLGDLGPEVSVHRDEALQLRVPLRSYRSPRVADWVAAVIDGRSEDAAELAREVDRYPLMMTRDLAVARAWLRKQGRGNRRFGLVASSGARRLIAEGLGVSLNATDGRNIAYWYLKPPSDVRSSFALEVTANEYTTQGLELDFVGVCWGGDFLYSPGRGWRTRQFRGNRWVQARGDRRRFIQNSYRVLMTRAREGLLLFVPKGSPDDPTRNPKSYESTAWFLEACGVELLEAENV